MKRLLSIREKVKKLPVFATGPSVLDAISSPLARRSRRVNRNITPYLSSANFPNTTRSCHRPCVYLPCKCCISRSLATCASIGNLPLRGVSSLPLPIELKTPMRIFSFAPRPDPEPHASPMLLFLVVLGEVSLIMNLRWASGPRAPADDFVTRPDAQRDDRGMEMAVTVRMLEVISWTLVANWRIAKIAMEVCQQRQRKIWKTDQKATYQG